MAPKFTTFALLVLLLGSGGFAYADDDPDATITVIDEGDTPDDIVRVIELPQHAADAASAKSGNASDTSDAAKAKVESGRDFGQQTSGEARDRSASEQSREARERGRHDARDDNAGDHRHGPPG